VKILYHHRIASKDGQFVHIEELTNALKKRGHEIIMVGPGIVDSDGFGSEGGFVSKLKRYVPGALYELMELGYSLHAFLKLRKAVRQHKPDCLYERYNLYLLSGVWLKKRFGLPMLLEVNAPLFQERSKYDGIALPGLARWTEQQTWCNASMVLPVTQVLADQVEQAGVSRERILVIHNGINPQRFSADDNDTEIRQKLGLEDKLVLGFTGFVREWHRLDRVVELLKPDQHGMQKHLLLVGDGPARKQIEDRARALGVEHAVTITGVIEREDVSKYVACFDIALQPDVVEYASPLKLFEYLALGRAIVAPNTANIREILVHEQSALLFEPGEEEDFLRTVERLLEDPELRDRIGHGARQMITEREFTWDANARKVEERFQALIDRAGRKRV